MAQLIVRGLSESLVRALAERAVKHKRSVEQEHRDILRAALVKSRAAQLGTVLVAMPNVGRDEDFVRSQ